MKQFSSIVLACALAIPVLAQDANTNAVIGTNNPAGAAARMPAQTLPASEAVLTAPLVLTNDYLVMEADQQEVAGGGKAVFSFSVTNAGNYVVEALVNAPDESSNSFYVNMDAEPVDPDMIWDIEVTTGFENRVVNWRGSGSDTSDDFVPKRFKLDPGAHTLVIVGREPGVRLKSVTFRPAPPE